MYPYTEWCNTSPHCRAKWHSDVVSTFTTYGADTSGFALTVYVYDIQLFAHGYGHIPPVGKFIQGHNPRLIFQREV